MAERKKGVNDGDHQPQVLVPRIERVPRQRRQERVMHQREDVIFNHGMGVVTAVMLPEVR